MGWFGKIPDAHPVYLSCLTTRPASEARRTRRQSGMFSGTAARQAERFEAKIADVAPSSQPDCAPETLQFLAHPSKNIDNFGIWVEQYGCQRRPFLS